MVTFGRVFRSLDCALRRRMDQALSGMDLTFSQGHIMGYLAHCDTPPCAKDIEDRFHLSHRIWAAVPSGKEGIHRPAGGSRRPAAKTGLHFAQRPAVQ